MTISLARNDLATTETLAELLNDGLFVDGDWVETKDQDPAGEVRLIQLADVGDGVFRNRSKRFLTEDKAEELRCTFLQTGDVLVARMPEPLGRACVFPGVGQPAVTAVDVCILRPDPGRINSEWLANAINAPSFRSKMEQFIRGTTRQRISRTNLGTLRISVPRIEEQRSAVRSINALRSKRDSAENHVSAASRAVERFQQAVLASASSGRLTTDWRQDPSDPQETGDLPSSWSSQSLGDIASRVTKGTTPTSYGHSFVDAGVAFIKVESLADGKIVRSSIRNFITDATHNAQARSILEVGDVLFSIAGTIGRTAIVQSHDLPANTNQALAIIRGTREVLLPEYLVIALRSALQSAAAEVARGSGMNNISLGDVKSFQIPVPPKDEQAEIVRRADALFAQARKIEMRLDSAKRCIDHTVPAALVKALRGDLVR